MMSEKPHGEGDICGTVCIRKLLDGAGGLNIPGSGEVGQGGPFKAPR